MIETRLSTSAPGFGWGARTHDEVARWRGRGPVFGRAGIVPVTITGPERYIEGARGPALLIERGSTNLVSNPRGGGGSGAPWIVDGDGAVEAILDETAPHGTALRLAGHTGTIARIYETIEDDAPSLEQGSPFAVRFLARALNEAAEDAPLHARLWEIGGASPSAITASITSTFTPGWTLHEFVGTIQASGRTELQLLLGAPYGVATSGAAYGLADIQCERRPMPSSYLDGSAGSGYAWIGTAHASRSERLPTSVRIGSLPRAHAVALWIRPLWGNASVETRTILEGGQTRLGFDGASTWLMEDGVGAVSLPATHDPGEDLSLVAGVRGHRLALALGATPAHASEDGSPPVPTAWILGGSDISDREADAALGPITWYNKWPALQARLALLRQ